MSEEATAHKLADHFAKDENELEDVKSKINNAEDKDREAAAKLRSSINHVEALREVSARLGEEMGEDGRGTVKKEPMHTLINSSKGTLEEIENAKRKIQEVLTELNLAEKELVDVLQRAETDKEAVRNLEGF